METKNNLENEKKFQLEFYHSDGFGQISNESEWVANLNEIAADFGDEIFAYIENWLNGDVFELEKNISDDEFIVVQTTSYGALRIAFCEEYFAGGYDDNPLYRYDADIYEIKPYTF